MNSLKNLFFFIPSVLCCIYIFPQVECNPLVSNVVKKNGMVTIKTNKHEASLPKFKSIGISESEFEEHLEPVADDPPEANVDTVEDDTPDYFPATAKSHQLSLKERWSTEKPAIYLDMAKIKIYTFSMKLDKLQLNFIGSRDLGCTVIIKCKSHSMHPNDFIQITDGLGGQITYSKFKKFKGYRKPSENGTDIYVRYVNKNPTTKCTATCMKTAHGYNIKILRSEPSFASSVDTTCECGEHKRTLQSKIVGGEEASPFEIPWQIAVVEPGKRVSFCGASLINDRYALSAAHCFYNDSRPFELLLHAHGLNQYRLPGLGPSGTIVYVPTNDSATKTDADEQSLRLKVEEIILHPLYDFDRDEYDVVLLRFKKKIDFSQHPDIRPVCLVSWKTQTDNYTGQTALVSGWGRLNDSIPLKSTTLQKVSVQMQSRDICRTGYQNIMNITSRMICAGYLEGGKDACSGDSGGPLSLKNNNKWRQIGVVSTGEGCAEPSFLGVYSNVGEMRQWIQRMVHRDTKWCQE